MQDINMQIKQKTTINTMIGQVIGIILGLVFVLTDQYEGIQFWLAIIGAPITFAGLIRFIMATHRIAKKYTGKQVLNDLGECIGVISNPLLTIGADVLAVMLLISSFTWLTKIAPAFAFIELAGLLSLEVFLFVQDIKLLIHSNKKA